MVKYLRLRGEGGVGGVCVLRLFISLGRGRLAKRLPSNRGEGVTLDQEYK